MKNKIKKQPPQYALKLTKLNQPLDSKNLKVLNLQGLQLQQFDIKVENLLTLILDFNNLRNLDIISQFPNLNTLSITNNQIEEFNVPSTLRILNISNNLLKTIHLKQLQQLDASSNQLQFIQQDQQNNLIQLKLDWLRIINQNDVWEHLTIKQFANQQQITFRQFLDKAIELQIQYGFKKEQNYFNQKIIHTSMIQNDKYYFDLILPYYKENRHFFDNSETPLCLAIKKLKMNFIADLMSNIPIKYEIDAFHESIKQGQISLVKQFLELGIDCNGFSQKGLTPLTNAVLNITQMNMEMIIHLLLQSQANPNKLNLNGQSLVQMCIIKSNLTALRFIINLNKKKQTKLKFKMNIKNTNGDYPLHLAVNSVSILYFLLNNQIGNPLQVNYQNLTAKQMPFSQNRPLIYKLLQKEERVQVAKQLAKNDMRFRILNKCQNTQKDYSSDSSCPELSEDEMPNKPKINRKYITEIDELSEDIRQLSEDEECQHNCSSESEIQYPKDNLKSLKLVQLNHQNYQLFKFDQHVRQKSILINKINKKRLNADQFNYYSRQGQNFKEKINSLICLRQELLLLGQIREYSDLICSDFASYMSKLNQTIFNLESDFQKDSLKDYMNFQQSLQVSIVDKYPDRVPILLEITDKSKIRFSDGSKFKKYLISKSDHFYHFFQILRNSLKLSKQEAIYLFVNNTGLIKPESQVGEIYSKHHSNDGFLRIILSEYATFGHC
ncbi:unnamed protein product [Paramecium pentaurelia]|uniref:Autophagy-related protein n=1 Tax=Paramecium pentaurelia TaxID=43138 RepID=A0A8S1VW89_9CILI|nr:unnamed protein product [Paramecium pentaurelia]